MLLIRGPASIIILYSFTILHQIRDVKDPEHPYSLEELNVVIEVSMMNLVMSGKLKSIY